MGDGQEVLEDFPTRCNYIDMRKEQHTIIAQVLCWGCGTMVEDVIIGEGGWLFCPCGTGIIKVTI